MEGSEARRRYQQHDISKGNRFFIAVEPYELIRLGNRYFIFKALYQLFIALIQIVTERISQSYYFNVLLGTQRLKSSSGTTSAAPHQSDFNCIVVGRCERTT